MFRACIGKGPQQSQANSIEIIEYLGRNGRTMAVRVRNARGLVAAEFPTVEALDFEIKSADGLAPKHRQRVRESLGQNRMTPPRERSTNRWAACQRARNPKRAG